MPVSRKAPKPRKPVNEFHPKPKPPTRRVGQRNPRGTKTWWSDDERAAALAALEANGGNVLKTANEHGIPYSTLQHWKANVRFPEGHRLRQDVKGDMATAMEHFIWQMLAMAPAKLDAAPLNHVIGGIDKLTEKMRLLRGESTSNNANRNEQVNPEFADMMANATPAERDELRRILIGIAQRTPPRQLREAVVNGGDAGES